MYDRGDSRDWTFDFFIFYSFNVRFKRATDISYLVLFNYETNKVNRNKKQHRFWFVHAIVLSAWKQLYQQLRNTNQIEKQRRFFIWVFSLLAFWNSSDSHFQDA